MTWRLFPLLRMLLSFPVLPPEISADMPPSPSWRTSSPPFPDRGNYWLLWTAGSSHRSTAWATSPWRTKAAWLRRDPPGFDSQLPGVPWADSYHGPVNSFLRLIYIRSQYSDLAMYPTSALIKFAQELQTGGKFKDFWRKSDTCPQRADAFNIRRSPPCSLHHSLYGRCNRVQNHNKCRSSEQRRLDRLSNFNEGNVL